MTDADLAAIRAHVGSAPDDELLDAAFTRLGTVAGVALEVLSGRYADMVANPADLTIIGDRTEKWGANIAALKAQMVNLGGAVPGSFGGVTFARMVRPGRDR